MLGSISGISYFTCAQYHGHFVRRGKLQHITNWTGESPRNRRRSSRTTRRRSSSTTSLPPRTRVDSGEEKPINSRGFYSIPDIGLTSEEDVFNLPFEGRTLKPERDGEKKADSPTARTHSLFSESLTKGQPTDMIYEKLALELMDENIEQKACLLAMQFALKKNDLNWAPDVDLAKFECARTNQGGNLEYLDLSKKIENLDLAEMRPCLSMALKRLHLHSNIGVKGDIQALECCRGLAEVELYLTSVSGNISVFGEASNLTKLNLYSSRVIGSINSLSKLRKLQFLDVGYTSVRGSIMALAPNTGLEVLTVVNTQISGNTEALQEILPNCFIAASRDRSGLEYGRCRSQSLGTSPTNIKSTTDAWGSSK